MATKVSPAGQNEIKNKITELEKVVETNHDLYRNIDAIIDFTDNQLEVLNKQEAKAELKGINFTLSEVKKIIDEVSKEIICHQEDCDDCVLAKLFKKEILSKLDGNISQSERKDKLNNGGQNE